MGPPGGNVVTKETDKNVSRPSVPAPSRESMRFMHPVRNRRLLSKYTDPEKASILWKVSLALTVFSVTLACTGLAVDQYDDDSESIVSFQGKNVTIPSVIVSTSSITLGIDGCSDEKGWKVNPMDSPLHSRGGMSFKDLSEGGKGDPAAEYFLDDSRRLISLHHSGSWEGISSKALVARVFGILGVVFQGIALLWIIGLRSTPSPFLFSRPLFGQTDSEHRKGMVPSFLLFLSGAMLMISLTIMSSVMPPIMSRVANFALDWCVDSPFDSEARGQDKLEYMIFLGNYIQNHADAQGVTFMTYAVSISLVYLNTIFLFYLSIRDVRNNSKTNYCLPDSQVRGLPFYCRIWPIRPVLALLFIAVIAECTSAYSARVRGFPLNIYFYNVKYLGHPNEESWSLSDIVLDTVHEYVIDQSVVRLLLAGWIPTVLLWGVGTGDFLKFFSKVVECFAVLMLASAIVGVSTVPPTPSFVLQKPQCYTPPQSPPSFTQFFSASESCNNQLLSLYSVLMLVPAMVQWHYIRYGAIRKKALAYIFLATVSAGSMMMVVVTRQQYSVDVYIGSLVTILYCLTQGPAFKLLFRFGAVHPGSFNRPQIVLSDKISSTIDDCIHRFELFFMATGGSWSKLERDDMLQTQSEFNNLLEAIDFAKEKSAQDAKENDISSDSVAVGTSIHNAADEENVNEVTAIEEDERFFEHDDDSDSHDKDN
jgi:hypothetical protein